MRHSQVLLWGALLLALPVAALADWPASSLVNLPVCAAPGGQSLGALVGDGAGGMIAVWEDTRGAGVGIFAQRVSGAGVPRWNLSGVPVCSLSGTRDWVNAVPDGAGGAFLAWRDFRSDPKGDIYLQRIDGNGVALWTDGGLPLCTAAASQYAPKLTADGAAGVVVVWSDQRVSPKTNFYAQRVDASGTAQWTPGGVALTSDVMDSQPPSVASDDSGGVIVTWHGASGGSLHPRVQRLDGAGQPRWGASGVALAEVSTQFDPCVVRDGGGGAIIVWADFRGGNGLTTTTYAQHVNAIGESQWTPDGVALSVPQGDQQFQTVVSDGAGGAIATWLDRSTTAIRAQHVSAAGVTQWALAGVTVCSATGNRQTSRMCPDGAGGVLVAWSDDRLGGSDVYVQRIDASGSALWPADGVATCTAAFAQVNTLVIPDGSGGAMVGWSDFRSADHYEVYAQRIAANGALGGSVLGAPMPHAPVTVAVRPAASNPQRGGLSVDCDLIAGEPATLQVFDVSGRCLAARRLAAGVSGTRRVVFTSEAGAWAPGVYLVRLVQGDGSAGTRMVLMR